MADWQVFQTDVLDVIRQYQGFLDFFERVGSLTDNSRPDCFCRITRNDKKEIWIVDAKNKNEIDEQDISRMNKYVDMIRSNPIDVGLELSELADHKVRGIFVTAGNAEAPDKFESVDFGAFHQFLQKELVYTDSDKVVRDVAKMMERRQLTHSQARLLFNSIKPFEAAQREAVEHLENLASKYRGLKLEKPPISSYDYNIPVDAVLTHEPRDAVFLIDIPYSDRAVQNIDEKISEIRSRLQEINKPVYYAAIDRFGDASAEYIYRLEDIESEIKNTVGVISPEDIAELFTPSIPVETALGETIKIVDKVDLGFQMNVRSKDDVNHIVEAILPDNAASELRNTALNSRRTLGSMDGNRFRAEYIVTENGEVKYGNQTESYSSFRETVRTLFHSSVSPYLAKKANQTYM